jgi:hypothetical protein
MRAVRDCLGVIVAMAMLEIVLFLVSSSEDGRSRAVCVSRCGSTPAKDAPHHDYRAFDNPAERDSTPLD